MADKIDELFVSTTDSVVSLAKKAALDPSKGARFNSLPEEWTGRTEERGGVPCPGTFGELYEWVLHLNPESLASEILEEEISNHGPNHAIGPSEAMFLVRICINIQRTKPRSQN